jgi:hypothetical protein
MASDPAQNGGISINFQGDGRTEVKQQKNQDLGSAAKDDRIAAGNRLGDPTLRQLCGGANQPE